MKIARAAGMVQGAIYCPSPNYNCRPDPEDISLLVIHAISLPQGQWHVEPIIELFQNRLSLQAHESFASLKGLQVSSHLLIDREGKVYQFVPLTMRAWHAGRSNFEGRDNCGDFSIGIELIGDDYHPFTQAQYGSLNALIKSIQHHYPLISADRITSHSTIAPGRKTDPGPYFDWSKIYKQ